MNNKKIKVLYLSFYSLIVRRYGINNYVTRKQLYCELGKHFIVPKFLRMNVIEELIDSNMIKKEDRENFIVLYNNPYYEELKCLSLIPR